MSFPRYPEYKDSGVDWLGEVPSHWDVLPIKTIASCNDDVLDEKTPDDFEIDYVEISDVDAIAGITGKTTVPFGFAPSRARRKVCNGDVLVSTVRTYLRAIAQVKGDPGNMIASTGFAVIRPRRVHSEYLGYACRAEFLIAEVIARSVGVSYPAINASDLMCLEIPVPSVDEQRAVSRFLNAELEKIDGLVAEQEKLIALLKEKRQAVISHAVTKGLDPNVPMKDSGIEWLGEVPAHWEIRKLSTITTKITNGFVGPTRDILVDEGVRYLQSLHIKGNKIQFDVPYYVRETWSLEHKKSILETGDVLIVQTGDIGQVAVVTEEFSGCNCHALIVCSPVRNTLCGEWLSWVLNTDYGRQSLLSIQTGALHPHLNCGNVRDLYIPVPSISEQKEICKFVESGLDRFGALIEESESAGLLLRERRSALISAAVTGKIDVRLYKAKEVA